MALAQRSTANKKAEEKKKELTRICRLGLVQMPLNRSKPQVEKSS